jgi:bifunctional non-homologous end joining protein LigD
MSIVMRANDIDVEISHPHKVLFPRDGITKEDVVRYYQKISDLILPYLDRRPINMQRFPDGIDSDGFYQKEIPQYFPDWIERASVELKGEGQKQDQVLCQKTATLLYLANLGCITMHRWLSRSDALDQPDMMIFDLDPPQDDFEQVRFAALRLHDLFRENEIASYVMTTGSQGLHVLLPLEPSHSFDTVRETAEQIADLLARRFPNRLTTEVRKEKRKGRLFLDMLRNAYAQTAVTPYALRALPGAPVATPLDWDELQDRELDAQRYRMENIFRRLGQKADPWQNVMDDAQSLETIQDRMDLP